MDWAILNASLDSNTLNKLYITYMYLNYTKFSEFYICNNHFPYTLFIKQHANLKK